MIKLSRNTGSHENPAGICKSEQNSTFLLRRSGWILSREAGNKIRIMKFKNANITKCYGAITAYTGIKIALLFIKDCSHDVRKHAMRLWLDPSTKKRTSGQIDVIKSATKED